jgi:hypothetical protein
MLLTSPSGLSDAAKMLRAKSLLPTSLDSAAIRGISASIRRQSLFSAQTLLTDLLEKYQEQLTELASSDTDPATARLEIKNFLDSIGLKPSGESGDITDITSDARINLVLKTNLELSQGAGHLIQQNNPKVIGAFPALELVRFEARKVPRDWHQRWLTAARSCGDFKAYAALADHGRMVALKDSPIWDALGSSELFPDGLDNPYPPFAFNSGMWTQDVSFDEAKSLGLLDDNTELKPRAINFENLFNVQKPGLATSEVVA